MEEKIKPEWKSDFMKLVLEYYNLEQYPVQSHLSIKAIRNRYPTSSKKAKKNRRNEVRSCIQGSYKFPSILKDNEGNIVKESDFKDTEELIMNCSIVYFYYPVHWWTLIKENGHEKDFIWSKETTGHGGWTWKETKIIHKPLNIYYQSE